MQLRKVTAASAVVLALALSATACGGDKKDDKGSSGGKKIAIGIKFDQPGLGQKTPQGYSGFDVDVATYVAKKLGYGPDQIEWKESKSADRETMLQRGDVQFIAATYSITPEREQKVDFAGPYLLAHQDVLLRATSRASSRGRPERQEAVLGLRVDLRAEPQGQAGPEGEPPDLPDLLRLPVGSAERRHRRPHHRRLDPRRYAAQTQFKGKFKLGGLKMTNENYGIGVKKGSDLKAKINKALESMVSDGSWEAAVKKNFGPANYHYEPAPKIGDIKS